MHHTAEELAEIRTKFQEALESECMEDVISSSSPLLILSESSSSSDAECEQPVKKKRKVQPLDPSDSEQSYSMPASQGSPPSTQQTQGSPPSSQGSPSTSQQTPSAAQSETKRRKSSLFNLPKCSPLLYFKLRRRSLKHTPLKRILRPRAPKK